MTGNQSTKKLLVWGLGYWRVLLVALAFAGLAALVFVISDRYAAKTATGFPNLQDYHFTLTDQYGAPTGPDRFVGRPLALFFGFTYCPDICPTTLTMLAAARDELAAGGTDMSSLTIAFITVDPERDTPQVLREYAERVGARRARWLWLTGERDTIWKLSSEGFLLPLAEGNPAMGDDDIIHSQYFVLLDGGARIRGVYDIRDSEAMLKLRGDIRRVHEENERGPA